MMKMNTEKLWMLTLLMVPIIVGVFMCGCIDEPEEKKEVTKPYCGDGICDDSEKESGECEEDCMPQKQDSPFIPEQESYEELKKKMKESSIDIFLPSESTGNLEGKLAVRLQLPKDEDLRYEEGAPVVVLGEGGATADGLVNSYVPHLTDMIVITFIYPGGENLEAKSHSDGEYDYRGRRSIMALQDVILYAAGEKKDSEGKTIDERVPYNVLHDNVGFIGFSFGGNIGVAAAALEGERIGDNLKYVIQWETPVSSQIATRDLGRMLFKPITAGASGRGDYFNPRYSAYDPLVLEVDYSDITYDANSIYPIFLDGNQDGKYTTIMGSHYHYPTSDLNDNGKLEINEDFGLDTYWYDTYDSDGKIVYSRPVTLALEKHNVFEGNWPSHIATVEEANQYWDIRESVRLYKNALENIPQLEGMFLLSEDDHVQYDPHKSHVHQAFDGWTSYATWFKINPDPDYLVEVDPSLAGLPLPSLPANTAPANWENVKSYCMPENIEDEIYQIAAVHQMADRVHSS
jgi:hypothetical protein